MNQQVIELFKKWQEKEDKYQDLDIEKVKFKEEVLKNIANFPAMTRVTGGTDLSIIDYNSLDENKKKNYVPLVSGTVENNQISGYVLSIRLTPKAISSPNIISWTRINGSKFFFQKDPVCTNDDSFILEAKEGIYTFYLQKALIGTQANSQFGWMNKAGQTKVKALTVPIPQKFEEFSSYQIQQVIIEFLDYRLSLTKATRKQITPISKSVKKIDSVILDKVFEMKDLYLCEQFDKWAEGSGYQIRTEDIQFRIKHIISNNPSETVCKKRMGFTPEIEENGDINWFTVSDLNKNNGLYINKPNTKDKTTIELIKQKVDKNNTGKSEKLIPIKKGDVLVSFKLTVGVVKIYNSDLPAYCNEAIDILTCKEGCFNKYIAYNCMLEYPKYGRKTNNGFTLNDESKKEIKIYTPQEKDRYTSLELQVILVEFIEAFYKWKDDLEMHTEEVLKKLDLLDNTILTLLFRE